MDQKRVLIVLGGEWHDFDGFAAHFGALLETKNWVIESTYDLDRLMQLKEGSYDLVVNYTCFTLNHNHPDQPALADLSDPQVHALAKWVRGGGAFLAAHAATVLGETNPLLEELIGGRFLNHPPQFSFTVYPVHRSHPITVGVEAFTVHDELYIQRCDMSVDVHMVAIDRGLAHPLVWSKQEGKGRVAHVALGHAANIWMAAPYQQLMLQTVAWLT